MLDDDRVRQAILSQPFLYDQLNAARVGKNRDQRDIGKCRGQIGKIEWQSGAHDDGANSALASLPHIVGITGHSAHDIDCEHSSPIGDPARGDDLAIQSEQVRRARSDLCKSLNLVGAK